MQLLPVYFAEAGDYILVDSSFSFDAYPHSAQLQSLKLNNIDIVREKDLQSFFSNHKDKELKFSPWGWNRCLRSFLLNNGAHPSSLPTTDYLDTLRSLSHRRTVIPFQNILQQALPDFEIPIASEFISTDEAMQFAESCPTTFFKAPWSSSGRGIINSETSTRANLRQWIHGCIRKQGSVMGEKGFERVCDFASEWFCKDNKTTFLGLSLFRTSSDGRYEGNITEPQDKIVSLIKDSAPAFSDDIIIAQKNAIDKLIAPRYSGPLGIDMLIDKSGTINPCVEINLRMTMGILTLKLMNNQLRISSL